MIALSAIVYVSGFPLCMLNGDQRALSVGESHSSFMLFGDTGGMSGDHGKYRVPVPSTNQFWAVMVVTAATVLVPSVSEIEPPPPPPVMGYHPLTPLEFVLYE